MRPKSDRRRGRLAAFVLLWAAAADAQPGPEDGRGGEEVEALRDAREALVAAGDFEGALAPAQSLVERLRAAGDPAAGDALAGLARIQAELEDYDAAELNYLDAIELIGERRGMLAAELVGPYHGLGRSYIAAGRFVEAITALEQARHISQRHLGLFNTEQSALIDDLTSAYLGRGDTLAAARLQAERLDNAVRRFGPDDPRVIPFRYELADYYERSRLRGAAREQYERVVETLQELPDADEAALLAPLRRLARIELLLGDRDRAHERLREILDGEAEIAPAERARSLAVLGDREVVRGNGDAARGYYARAWELLSEAPQERSRLFARPEPLDFVAPLTAVDRNTRSRPYAWGTIVLRLDVAADGTASSVEAVSAEPAGLVEQAYASRLRAARFRPRVADAVPRASEGVRFTHRFRYYTDED